MASWRELQPATFRYGNAVEAPLEKLPQAGPLFPYPVAAFSKYHVRPRRKMR